MDLAILLDEALAERGNVVALIARPRDGEGAVIQVGNIPFARLFGWPAKRISGLRLNVLRPFIVRDEDWASLIASARSLSALSLDLRLRVNGREVWLGFNLTFKVEAAGGDAYGILIGRDITETRERSLRESESQRLLASVFLRIGAAVAIIDSEGAILMTNPACQHLLGYGAGEATGRHVEDLIAPESAAAVRAARAKQPSDGGSYDLRISLLAKGGARVPVTLHSASLRDARDRQLRVATLIPDSAPTDPLPAAHNGQVREVSLAALKAAHDKDWNLIAGHAMRLTEEILTRHLDAADILRQRNDHSYLIWFHGENEAHDTAVLAAATQEIRQRLLEDADALAPDFAGAVSIGAEAEPLARAPISLAEIDLDLEDDEYLLSDSESDSLLRYLRAGTGIDVEIVIGRDGVERPIILVDFEAAVRGRLYRLAPSLVHEPVVATGFDLIRIDMAVKALEAQSAATNVVVPVSWTALADPACRPALDRQLVKSGSQLQSRIMLAVSDVPRLLAKQRWSEAIDPWRRRLGDIGLLLTHREGELQAVENAITNEWPLSLLVVDRTEGPPVLIEEYRSLFAAARRREIAVLVRTTARNDIRDWRRLGATLFAATA